MKSLTLAALLFAEETFAVPFPYFRLTDNLDEPENYGFCLDLRGWLDSTRYTKVHVHSCKEKGD